MKLSLDWIGEFVDLSGVDLKRFGERITLAVAEVEDVEVVERSLRGVVVAEVLDSKKIDAKLSVATVDTGRSVFVTVCGAPNVRPGMKAAFAPIGTVIAGRKKVEVAEIAGHPSHGVLCSAFELGLSKWHEVLFELPRGTEKGAPLSDLIPEQDVIIDIDNKSLTHRPDLWGHYGFAREVAAVLRRELRDLERVDLSKYDALPAYPVQVEDFTSCPVYSALELSVGSHGTDPSPLIIQRRLHAVGQRSHNLLVDLTNYVMLELAQPTHAFDGDKIRGIRVARPKSNLDFVTLDGQKRNLTPEDLLIYSGDKPIALAGVMGGADTEVGPGTQRLLLESANFQGSRVRRTSTRLGLRTDAVQRFEKNQPRFHTKMAAARIVHWLEKAGAEPKILSRWTMAGDLADKPRALSMRAAYVEEKAGAPIPAPTSVEILRSLGFGAEIKGGLLELSIPPHRVPQDISIPADIVEEVLRVYGYDRIEPRSPELPIGLVDVNPTLRAQHKTRRVLAMAHQFVEVQTYGWTDENWLAEIGFTPPARLELKNTVAPENRFMRTTLVPNVLALVAQNRPHRESFRLFELARVYNVAADGKVIETDRLTGASYVGSKEPSPQDHIALIKGALEDLLAAAFAGKMDLAPIEGAKEPWLASGHAAAIEVGGKHAGALGMLSPELSAKVARGGQVVWFDLAIDELPKNVYPAISYVPLPVYPSSWRDYSLLWSGTDYGGLAKNLDAFEHPLIRRREFLYAYRGKGLPPGMASYTFRYWMGAADHTLSTAEIEELHQAFLKHLGSRSISIR